MIIDGKDLGNLFLAPMAGVTDVGFRAIARKNGATFSCTEMVNARALLSRNEETLKMLKTTEFESPVAVQIFGKEPEIMAECCKMKELEKFDFIDINMGCPAKKIVSNGEGSALLKNLPLAREIISACVKTGKSISVKMRKGYGKNDTACLELAKICEEEGVKFITIHGRTQSQGYSGYVDYDIMKKLKSIVKIPVVGNGDVIDKKSYEEILKTGVDAVMIGRGTLGKPYIFNELKGQKNQTKTMDMIKEHISILRESYNEKYLNLYLRKHLLWYVRDIPNATKIRKEIISMQNIDEIVEKLETILV